MGGITLCFFVFLFFIFCKMNTGQHPSVCGCDIHRVKIVWEPPTEGLCIWRVVTRLSGLAENRAVTVLTEFLSFFFFCCGVLLSAFVFHQACGRGWCPHLSVFVLDLCLCYASAGLIHKPVKSWWVTLPEWLFKQTGYRVFDSFLI